ncbi:MAG: zinc ribbon domain-containing protein [Fimbriimonadaceae bacterium]
MVNGVHFSVFGIGLFVLFPMAVWVVGLIHWMIMGEIDTVNGLIGIAVGIAVGLVAIFNPDPRLTPFVVLVLFATIASAPVYLKVRNDRELVRIDVETMEDCLEALRQKPENIGARWRLAKTLYNRGFRGQALAIGEESIGQLQGSGFQEERGILQQWRRKVHPEEIAPLSCLECGYRNRPGAVFCEQCGANHLIHHVQGRWIGPELAQRLVAAWAAASAALVGIPALALFLPPPVAAAGIALVLAGGTWLVWKAFHRPEAGAAG